MAVPQHLPGVPYSTSPPRVEAAAAALALPPRLVVIHDTSNTASASSEASYAATRGDAQAAWTSAHFYVDQQGPLGSERLDRQAWAAYSYANSHGWHIEMCGMNAGQPDAVPARTIAETASLVARLCDLGGIPKVKLTPAQVASGQRGICGHYDITTGLGVGTHDDPGPAFNWPAFIAAVNGEDAMSLDDTVPGTDGRSAAVVLSDIWSTCQREDSGLAPGQLTALQRHIHGIEASLTTLGKAVGTSQVDVPVTADQLAAAIRAVLPELAKEILTQMAERLDTPPGT